jgi:hypothetical protein
MPGTIQVVILIITVNFEQIMLMMYREADFEDIRPYHDHEINAALKRIIENPYIDRIMEFLFPGQDHQQIKEKLASINTANDFQRYFMYPVVKSIIKNTSDGLTFEGSEYLTPGTPYLFVANHRDIVLDSAFMQVFLVDNGHETSEITFGSNLMMNQFVIDFGKVNKMFRVERGGNKAELIANSKKLSAYIRHTITRKKVSVWIAQRPGRTKNGNDKTEAGLLKMFNMSGTHDFIGSFYEMNIVPLVISYEYEPCCAFKIKEMLATRQTGSYRKKPDEDITSIITGITQPKGRIHMAVAKPANMYLETINEKETLNNKLNRLAELMDEQFYSSYKLWPGNYIAFDMLSNSDSYSSCYTNDDRERFLKYMETETSGIEGDRKSIEEMFLQIYANPIKNLNRSR